MEIRFATRDPALAPQPVWLRMGGGARGLFLKVSHSFEATRADFTRVRLAAEADQAQPAVAAEAPKA
ncbi:hypothetical protein K0B96_06820 [Horticoccus luteus]|uniref:Uncharacterized protein n=1 Tax=Horticoccus luteus TaxID=2862869 RepID=A0A8F9XMK0_9BACT|nr:hypothetical protein [Horticoccus luteus]QYM80321.1 hypothetical protein K0B96_06820 [Horticoccus luteus]